MDAERKTREVLFHLARSCAALSYRWVDRDQWSEVLHTMRRHRLRTVLTGAGVWWGIFVLVVLLGVGKGVENATLSLFDEFAINLVSIQGQRTSLAFGGLNAGRSVKLTPADIKGLARLPGVQAVSPQKQLSPDIKVRRGSRVGAFEVTGVYPVHEVLHKTRLRAGRLLHALDLREARKVAQISTRAAGVLFADGQSALGRHIVIGEISFLVIGIFEQSKINPGGEIRIPFTTLQRVFDPGAEAGSIFIGLLPGHSWADVKPHAMRYLSAAHAIDPNDATAVQVVDFNAFFQTTQTAMTGLRWFVSFIGIATLIAGCVAVSNIMLMGVKERTREIGIRKVLGATPGSIIAMIMKEALALTLAFGSAGLLAAVGLIELLRGLKLESEFFQEPAVNLSHAVGTLVVLVVAGLLAGFFPARQAVNIQPIEALRRE